jgi:hypothetical protein
MRPRVGCLYGAPPALRPIPDRNPDMTENWRTIAGSEGNFENEAEEWREIPGWEGRYEISSWGRCRSLDRVVTQGGRWGPVQHRIKGRILKPQSNGRRGHLKVQLGRRRREYVHRLVLTAFRGPCPPGFECRHLDGNPSNNTVSNLTWGSQSENTLDRVRHGTHHWAN